MVSILTSEMKAIGILECGGFHDAAFLWRGLTRHVAAARLVPQADPPVAESQARESAVEPAHSKTSLRDNISHGGEKAGSVPVEQRLRVGA